METTQYVIILKGSDLLQNNYHLHHNVYIGTKIMSQDVEKYLYTFSKSFLFTLYIIDATYKKFLSI